MGPITAIIPVPRRCPIGGETVLASEFRLRDIAELQSILDDEWPDPIDEVRAALASAPQEGKGRFLRIAPLYERAEVGPPVYGAARGHEFYGTPEGGAVLLWVAGRRHTPGLDPAKAARLFVQATADEMAKVWRVAHGVSSLKALENMLWDCLPGGQGQGKNAGNPATWAEMIDELARANHWTYETVYDLTLTQWITARNAGKVPETTRRVGAGPDGMGAVRTLKSWWDELHSLNAMVNNE